MGVDTFFVGDGSQKLMDRGVPDQPAFTDQIAVKDDNFVGIDRVDDVSLFSGSSEVAVQVNSYKEVLWAYQSYKAEAYAYFDFVKIKSLAYGDVPMTEEDLILSDRDKSLIEYLQGRVRDLYIWKNIAYLQAFLEMRVDWVIFQKRHDCSLCSAAQGTWHRVDSLLGQLCEGEPLVHDYCSCRLFPVVKRESYEGPLLGYMDCEVDPVGPVDLVNVPVELRALDSFNELLVDFPHLEIEFVNFLDWSSRGDRDLEDGAVVCLEDETLFVHNSYVGTSGPVEFIRAFLKEDTMPLVLSSDQVSKASRYILRGRNVLKYRGVYYRADTLERIK